MTETLKMSEVDIRSYCPTCHVPIEKNVIEVLTVTKITKTPVTYYKQGSVVAGSLDEMRSNVTENSGKYSYECSRCGGSIPKESIDFLLREIKKR